LLVCSQMPTLVVLVWALPYRNHWMIQSATEIKQPAE
jgi:hypothetical protein